MNSISELALQDSQTERELDLGTITAKAEEMNVQMETVAALEATLSEAKAKLKKIQEEDIPACLDELGIAEIKLADGRKLGYRPFYSFSVANDTGYKWLEDNGHAGIVKGELKVPYRFEDRDMIQKIAQMIQDGYGMKASHKMSVHPQTGKSFVKECDEEGIPLNEEYFKIYRGRKGYLK